MELIHDSSVKWWQSDVYSSNWKCIKKYKYLDNWEALEYLQLQSLFNEVRWVIHLPKPFVFCEYLISSIDLSFATLDDIREDWYIVAEAQLIEWNTLTEMIWQGADDENHIALRIINLLISDFISEISELDLNQRMTYFGFFEQINGNNLKFSWYDEEQQQLSIVVTDIALDISQFLLMNKQKIKAWLSLKELNN